MNKRIIFISLILFLFLETHSYSQSYRQFIYRKPQQESLLDQFFRFWTTRDPFNGSYAMVIGVGDYDNLPSLDSPSPDAERMKNFLLKTAEYDEVVVLKDADATADAIRFFMEEYFPIKMDTGQHRFLFYFTGHGTQRKGYARTLGYLQLKGATEGLTSDVINMDQIGVWADQLPNAKHMLFLIDSCFSGLAGVEVKGTYDSSVDPLELAKEYGRFMITAGGVDETAIASLKEWGGSLFTQVALRGMSGYGDSNQDGIVTTHELFGYIQSVVKNEAAKRGRKQTPALRDLGTGTEKGQYFFVYKSLNKREFATEPDVDIDDLQGVSFAGRYETRMSNGEAVIIDHNTGLMWQQSGSPNKMTWHEAKRYIGRLNNERHAGYVDWRLPTIEELQALIESQQTNGVYIDTAFDPTQIWCWSSNSPNDEQAWMAIFNLGKTFLAPSEDPTYVRAVRSGQ